MKSVHMQDVLDFSHLQKSCLCKYYIINYSKYRSLATGRGSMSQAM